jgi:hypothetical protein
MLLGVGAALGRGHRPSLPDAPLAGTVPPRVLTARRQMPTCRQMPLQQTTSTPYFRPSCDEPTRRRFVPTCHLLPIVLAGVSADPDDCATTSGLASSKEPAMIRTPFVFSFSSLQLSRRSPRGPRPGASSPYLRDQPGARWPSRQGTRPLAPGSELTAVRAGQHACYDRLVLDITALARRVLPRRVRAGRHGPTAPERSFPLKGGTFLQISLGVNNTTAPTALTGDVGTSADSDLPRGRLGRRLRGVQPAQGLASGRGFRSASSTLSGPRLDGTGRRRRGARLVASPTPGRSVLDCAGRFLSHPLTAVLASGYSDSIRRSW